MLAIVQDVYRQLQNESLKWNYCPRFVESVIIYCVLFTCLSCCIICSSGDYYKQRLQLATFIHNVLEVLDDNNQYGYNI